MYKREITNYIVECWGLGLTAEETVKAINQTHNVHIGLATIYRHRHNITAQIIIDELIRKQLRDIAKSDNPTARMKYRDKLLAKLIPQRIEAYQKMDITERREVAFKLDDFDPDERKLLESVARRYIKANNKTESSTLH